MTGSYDIATFKALTFHDCVPDFLAGTDTPSAYLERCIATIEQKEPEVKAWVSLRLEAARATAAEATQRYAAGKPLSLIDGMPIGVKDTLQVRDLPTTEGINGYEPVTGKDTAAVQALEAAGAIIVGKAVSTELGGAWPNKTNNPFDLGRTPGGSSSGSAAAVGARMIPAAIGTQVGGSIIRPAAFCANFALKPTQGGLNRGERQGLSQSTIGVHAGSLEDLWRVAIEIAKRAGGDPGHPGLFGGDMLAPPVKPRRLIVMETEGWAKADPRTRDLFEKLLDRLLEKGVEILRRGDDLQIEAFEQALAVARSVTGITVMYENHWSLSNLMRLIPDKLSPAAYRQFEHGPTITQQMYRKALVDRDSARAAFAALAPLADALISPACLGPAIPHVEPQADMSVMPTGDPVFNMPTSALGSPALTLPLFQIEGMPVGVQLVGQWHDDEKLSAHARWMMEEIEPAVA
jgi:Asp-tRNA(Asn)/Glu-tRNA(Gln) amidotransferase A subunit family amidase